MKDLAALLICWFAGLLLLYKQTLLGEAFVYGDIFNFFYPTRTYVASRLLSGEFPLWMPYTNLGCAALAEPQFQVLYPLHLPFLWLPADRAICWSLVLHLWLAGVASYWFIRECLALHRLPAIFGAVAFMLCGFVQGHMIHLNIVFAFPYLPVMLVLWQRAVSQGRLRWAVLGGVAFAFQFLSGSAQLAYYTLLFGTAYTLVTSRQSPVTSRQSPVASRQSPVTSRQSLATGYWLMATGVIGFTAFLLSAEQLLPSLDSARFSLRSGSGYEFAARCSLPPEQWLWTFLLPASYGTFRTEYLGESPPEEFVSSMGMATLTLAVLSLSFWKKDARVRFFALAAPICLVLAFGKHTPLFKLAYPLISLGAIFRCPARLLYLVSFSLAVLSAYGAQFLLQIRTSRLLEARLLAAHGFWVGYPTSFVQRGHGKWLLKTLCFWCALLLALMLGELFNLWKHTRFQVPETLKPDLIDAWYFRNSPQIAASAYCMVLLAWAALYPRTAKVIAALFLFVLLAEQFTLSAGMHFNATVPRRELQRKPLALRVIRPMKDRYVLDQFPVSFKQLAQRRLEKNRRLGRERALVSSMIDLLFYDQGVRYRRRVLGGTGLLLSQTRWYQPFGEVSDKKFEEGRSLYRAAGVRYIVGIRKINDPTLIRHRLGDIFVHEDPHALPPVYFVRKIVTVANDADSLKLLQSPSFDPAQAVVIVSNDQIPMTKSQTSIGHWSLAISHWSPERILLRVRASASAWLVFLDGFHPGWKCWVNGKRMPIFRSNLAFRCVQIEREGAQEVTMLFLPITVKLGFYVSQMALLLLGAKVTFGWTAGWLTARR